MNTSFMYQCIRKLIRSHLLFVIFFVLLLVSSIVASLLPAQFLRYIIDEMMMKSHYEFLVLGALCYFGIIVLVNGLEMLKQVGFVWIGQSLTQIICSEMMKKIRRIETSYFTKVDASLISSYFLNDAQTISNVFSSGVIAMAVNCFKIIGIILSIALFSKTLAFVLVILLPLLLIFTRILQKKMLTVQIKSRLYTADMTKIIHDALVNSRIMKVFHTQKYHDDKFKGKIGELFETQEKINFYDSLYSPLTQILRALVIVFVVFLSSDYLSFSSLTIGMCAASIELISQLFAPIEELGMELQSIQQAFSGIKRLEQFSALDEEKEARHLSYEELFAQPSVELIFDHVSFSYDENAQILKDVSFKCDDSRRNIIVGRTGVGKSTMFHLMMGLYQPLKGKVTINGYSPTQIKREDLRKVYGLIDQNFSFIQGTLDDQITLKDESYTHDQVEKVIQLVGLHDKVSSFEKGYDTFVYEEMFSKGECQLLSIARALIANPKILLLDEMGANLDAASEKKMMDIFDKISKNRLVLSITHHLDRIEESDQIIYLKEGRRVESFEK